MISSDGVLLLSPKASVLINADITEHSEHMPASAHGPLWTSELSTSKSLPSLLF